MKRFIAVFVTALVLLNAGLVSAFDSGDNPGVTGANTITWTGQGASDGELDTENCPSKDVVPAGIDPNSYLHWIFTTDGGSSGPAVLHLGTTAGGNQLGDYTEWAGHPGHFFTPYFAPDTSTLFAYASFTVLTTGNGSWNLVISHGCPGELTHNADLTVTKTAAGSYDKTYIWDIDKSADTDEVNTAGGDAADVNYTVTVSHDDGTVSNVKVSGSITVLNGETSAVTLSGVTDVLSDSTACTVNTSGGLVVSAGGSKTYPYTCSLGSLPSGSLTNKATASWAAQGNLNAGSADFTSGAISFTANEIDECVVVSDTVKGVLDSNLCVGEDNPATYTYKAQVDGPAGTCTDNDNTASFVTNDTSATDSAKWTVSDCQGADLIVTKTATPAYDVTYKWDIDKSVDDDDVLTAGGAPHTYKYTVELSHDAGTPSNWTVTGKITIENPNDWESVTLTSLTDAVDNGGICTVDTGPYVVPAADEDGNGKLEVGYSCSYASAPTGDGTNTATATWNAEAASTPSGADSGTADVDFSTTTPSLFDECNTVSDTNEDFGDPVTVCVGDDGDVDGTFTFDYSSTFTDPAGTCTKHYNTASFETSDLEATGSSDTVTVQDCQGADLTVSKTATPSYDLKYTWYIEKNVVGATSQTVDAGFPAIFNYSVAVGHNAGVQSNWKVTGTITVNNPNDWEAVTVNITDAINNGGTCTVTGGTSVSVPASGSVNRSYTCTYSSAPSPTSGTNTATVTWDKTAASTPNGSATGTAGANFASATVNTIDECVSVTDSVKGALGTACVGEANPKTFTYSVTYYGPAAGTCVTKPNTATFTTNDTHATGSDSKSVQVCSFKGALTIGYWKNHLNPISASCKSNQGCSANGPWTTPLLDDTICNGCLVGKVGNYAVNTQAKALGVFDANNCSNATTSNSNAAACLAAQLLGAKLNVANGANTCICDTIKLADAFLKAVGYNGPGSAVSFGGTNTRAYAIQLKDLLDNYNNGVGCH